MSLALGPVGLEFRCGLERDDCFIAESLILENASKVIVRGRRLRQEFGRARQELVSIIKLPLLPTDDSEVELSLCEAG